VKAVLKAMATVSTIFVLMSMVKISGRLIARRHIHAVGKPQVILIIPIGAMLSP